MRLRRASTGETPEQTLERLARLTSEQAHLEGSAPERRQFRLPEASSAAQNAGVALAFGLFLVWVLFPSSYLPWNHQTATTTGTVVSMGSDMFGGEEACDPRVDFTVAGERYTAKPSASTDPCPWAVGASATVRYDPAQPWHSDVVKLDGSHWVSFALPLAVLALGVVFAVLAVLSLLAKAAKSVSARRR
jgi:hypothetical protein